MSPNAATGFNGRAGWIASRPIAHRGLHDKATGIFENTLGAARRAVEQGFGIEVDLHPSSDHVPMVFHDDTLERLTSQTGSMRDRSAQELNGIRVGGSEDGIPTLQQLLDLVQGKVPLVLEMKGIKGLDDGFVAAIGKVLAGYHGPVALMSFDHWLIEDAHRLLPHVPLGLTAEGDDSHFAEHDAIAKACDVDFVSYGIRDLPCRFVQEFRESGRPVITWTIRNRDDMAKSARHADQITFEGFDPR
ncbi:MAG: glycerophosphodiester phosphodiesterase [Nitratireductor sp.]|nr:glycerophosphodiester phosphodiesterase [Nitratireductor sp.]